MESAADVLALPKSGEESLDMVVVEDELSSISVSSMTLFCIAIMFQKIHVVWHEQCGRVAEWVEEVVVVVDHSVVLSGVEC